VDTSSLPSEWTNARKGGAGPILLPEQNLETKSGRFLYQSEDQFPRSGLTLPEAIFVDEKGEQIEIGSARFTGLDNYIKIVTDPEIQLPFVRIFLWTVAFSAISAAGAFAIGMVLAVILEWKEMRLRKVYRTLLILPYAVPAVLSILIFKGLFNQEFGAVNEFLHAVFRFAPQWETNPWGARAMVLLVNLWLGYPYMMLICTGMLQIDSEQHLRGQRH